MVAVLHVDLYCQRHCGTARGGPSKARYDNAISANTTTINKYQIYSTIIDRENFAYSGYRYITFPDFIRIGAKSPLWRKLYLTTQKMS